MKPSNKKRASIADIRQDLRPFIKRSILASYVEANDVTAISRLIRGKYSNVDICPKPGKDGYPYLVIRVGTVFPTEFQYEIRTDGVRNKTHDPLSWIDRIEEWDALGH